MKIAIDLSPVVHRKAGLATYTRHLAASLLSLDRSNEYHAFHYGVAAEPLAGSLSALPLTTVPRSARRWRLSVAAQYLSGATMDRVLPAVDIFHATEHLLPRFKHVSSVFTFHDAIYALFPQYHLPLNRAFLGLMMPRFLRSAQAIIAVSECSKRDAIRLYHIAPDKVTVVHEAADPKLQPETNYDLIARARARYAQNCPFILCLSTIEPRKNIPALVDALKVVREHGLPHRLLIAGRKGWLYQPAFDHVARSGMADRVAFLDYVPDADLPALFAGCDAFVFPSLYEGFGLPPLEAMACGAPVICSNTSSLPEVVGEAALTVDPHDVRAIAGAVERVVADTALQNELRARGFKQSAKFSWDRAARETLAIYERVAAASGQNQTRGKR